MFLSRLTDLLDEVASTQAEAFDQAAELTAKTLNSGGLVHLFGSGHSVIPTLDAYPRYGSFVGLHPLTDPRLMWHNVLGPGGVRELLWLERTEGYIRNFLDHEPLSTGDTLVVVSHSGRNAAGIDAAIYARERGLHTIAINSSHNHADGSPHSTGNRLVDVIDVLLDTRVPVEDALVPIDGWDRPVSGASTIVATAVMQELIARTAAELSDGDVTLPTFVSPTVPGADLTSNDLVFDEHRRRLAAAQQRRLE